MTTDVWPDRASAIKTEVRTRRITSLLIFGGAALLALLPFAGIAPFVDGRADMYGNDFIARYRAIENLPAAYSFSLK